MKDNDITVIVRQIRNVGIDSKLNGWNLQTETMLKTKYYNGRICYDCDGKRIGLATLRKSAPCKIIIRHRYPF